MNFNPLALIYKLFKRDTRILCQRCKNATFYHGPSGGAAEMVECAQCGKNYLLVADEFLEPNSVPDYHLTKTNAHHPTPSATLEP